MRLILLPGVALRLSNPAGEYRHHSPTTPPEPAMSRTPDCQPLINELRQACILCRRDELILNGTTPATPAQRLTLARALDAQMRAGYSLMARRDA